MLINWHLIIHLEVSVQGINVASNVQKWTQVEHLWFIQGLLLLHWSWIKLTSRRYGMFGQQCHAVVNWHKQFPPQFQLFPSIFLNKDLERNLLFFWNAHFFNNVHSKIVKLLLSTEDLPIFFSDKAIKCVDCTHKVLDSVLVFLVNIRRNSREAVKWISQALLLINTNCGTPDMECAYNARDVGN